MRQDVDPSYDNILQSFLNFVDFKVALYVRIMQGVIHSMSGIFILYSLLCQSYLETILGSDNNPHKSLVTMATGKHENTIIGQKSIREILQNSTISREWYTKENTENE